jgi:hypothetical protein
MTNAWYDDLKDDDAKFYEESINRIRKGVEQGMTFEQAVSLVEVKDDQLKAAIIDDALKVLIAEMHFVARKPMEDVAKKLRLSKDALMKARQEMIESVEDAAIEAYKKEHGQEGQQGNA